MENVSVNMISTESPVYFIDEKEIKDLVKNANPTNKIGDINIPELEQKISKIPAIDSANVYINLNGNLMVDVKQRVPVFRLNNREKVYYVDKKGVEFPISRNYSFPCILVTGSVKPSEYIALAELINKINTDDFCKNFFIGINKEKGSYELITNQGSYKVEIGNLEHIDLKVKGFKVFVEKFLVYQNPEKYSKISLKYSNQIVTTLNPNFKENDSILAKNNKEIALGNTVPIKKIENKPVIQTTIAPEKKKEPEKKLVTKPVENKKTEVKKNTTIMNKKTTQKPTEKTTQKTTKK